MIAAILSSSCTLTPFAQIDPFHRQRREPGTNKTGKGDKRIEGLHPDSPITARTLKELRAPGLE